MVCWGSRWRRASAAYPTRMSPLGAKATTDGWRRLPWKSGMTSTRLPRTVATTELVVPRSMPMTGSTGVELSVSRDGCGGSSVADRDAVPHVTGAAQEERERQRRDDDEDDDGDGERGAAGG